MLIDKKNKTEIREDSTIIVCSCGSLEHQVNFWYDDEDNALYAYTHLYNSDGFFGRLKHAIKYLFGYTSRYGAWDEMIFDDEGQAKLRNFLNKNQNDGKENILHD